MSTATTPATATEDGTHKSPILNNGVEEFGGLKKPMVNVSSPLSSPQYGTKNERLSQFSSKTIHSQESEQERTLNLIAEKCRTPEEKKAFLTEMEGFKELFKRFKESKGKSVIDWDKIRPPHEDMVLPMGSLPECPEDQIGALAEKLCVLKLNGGLGTTMGCKGPKSVIEVHSEMSFLDLTVGQIEDLNNRYSVDVPLILMNSFNTHDDTLKVIQKYQNIQARILNFNQSRYPRILKESLLPMATDPIGDLEQWYPP